MMASLHPLLRTFSVYAIYDEGRDCFLGREGDHWMIISRQQFQDLVLYDSPQEAWAVIAQEPGLHVRELVIDIAPGVFASCDASPKVSYPAKGEGVPSSSFRATTRTV